METTFSAAEKLTKLRKNYIAEVERTMKEYEMGFHTIPTVNCYMLDLATSLAENEAKLMSNFSSEKDCIEINAIAQYIETKSFEGK